MAAARKITVALAAVLLTLVFSCQPQSSPPNPGFYHWKSTFAPSEAELRTLQDTRRLYLHFFDVDLDEKGQCIPVAHLNIKQPPPAHLEVIPTVFITNRAMLSLDEDEARRLANQVHRYILETQALLPEATSIPFWQMDCDWSPSSQAAYFAFLAQLKDKLADTHQQLSATIRLHQYRYPKQTGTPPIDRGTLMVYNMGEVSDWETHNSILDTAITWSYIEDAPSYPISLDVALPVFRWGAVFREGQLAALLHGLSPTQLADTTRFQPLAPHRYRVKKSTYLEGKYLYADDAIRLETVDTASLRAVNATLARHLPPASTRDLIWYHLDENNLQHFPPGFLEALLAQWP